jgi:hypothetical protein
MVYNMKIEYYRTQQKKKKKKTIYHTHHICTHHTNTHPHIDTFSVVLSWVFEYSSWQQLSLSSSEYIKQTGITKKFEFSKRQYLCDKCLFP